MQVLTLDSPLLISDYYSLLRAEVPIMLGLSARITLLKFETSETISEKPILDENLFKLPEDFTLMKEEEMDAKMKSLFQ